MLKKVTSIRHDISKLHCLEGEGRSFTHKANLEVSRVANAHALFQFSARCNKFSPQLQIYANRFMHF